MSLNERVEKAEDPFFGGQPMFEIYEDVGVIRQFEVRDLSGELVRKYLYADGEIVIDDPATLYIAVDSESHRVLGSNGWVTYIPNGWIAIQWLPRDPNAPVAF